MKKFPDLTFFCSNVFSTPLGFPRKLISPRRLSFLKGRNKHQHWIYLWKNNRVGDSSKEEDIKSKKNEMNIKEPGSSDMATKWEEDKQQRVFSAEVHIRIYQYQRHDNGQGCQIHTHIQYKMIEPGYQVSVSKGMPALMAPSWLWKPMTTVKLKQARSRTSEENMFGVALLFDAGSRIADAYYLSKAKGLQNL